MLHEPSRIADLLVRDLFNELNEVDRTTLRQWLEADVKHLQLAEKMYLKPHWLQQNYKDYDAIDNEATWAIIQQHLSVPARRNTGITPTAIFRNKVAIRYLLAGLCVSGIGVAAIVHYTSTGKKDVIAIQPTQPAPATDQAYLSYAGGPAIALKDYRPGWAIKKGNMVINKPSEGVVRISMPNLSPESMDETVDQVALSTPMGGKYRIIMPDSSVISLNAASTVAFRGSFNQRRRVILRGEGYFEVKPLNRQDFVVELPQTLTIIAIGTVFDVRAYADDSRIQASLLSGHLLVKQPDSAAKYLSPGEAFVVDHLGQGAMRPGIDTANAVSWKNGQFVFVHQPIMDILHELSRWYNIDFDIQGQSDDPFDFAGSRSKSLVNLLDQLTRTGHIHYSIRNDKIIISLNTTD
jgi:hypothetical protein